MLFHTDVQFGGNRAVMPILANAGAFPSAASSKASLAFADDVDTLHYSSGAAWLKIVAGQGAALSVLGVTGNAAADYADIAAGSDGHVLRRSGTSVGFGTIQESAIADGSILARVGSAETIAGLWDFQGGVLLRDSMTYIYDEGDNTKLARFQLSGITTGTTRNFTLPNSDGTIALTLAAYGGTGQSAVAQGDLLYGSATDTWSRLPKDTNATRYLANTGVGNSPAWGQVNLANGVTGLLPLANLADGSALSVLGRSANSAGVMAAIAAGSDHQVLRRSGTSLAFGAINLASANAVTGDLPFTNLATLAGLSVLGRSANSTGDMAAITGTAQTGLQVRGTTLGFFPLPSKTFFTTVATLPTTVLDTVEIGTLTHSEAGRTAFVEIDIIIAAPGLSLVRKYIYPIYFNHTQNGNWVRLAPFFSNGKYANEDFELEVQNIGAGTSPTYAYDVLRLVRTSGSVAGSADVVIQYYGSNVDANDFTPSSGTGTSTSPGMHTGQAFAQVRQYIGVNTPNPVANLDLWGNGNTSASDAFRAQNSDGTRMLTIRNDGRVGVGTITSPTGKLHVLGYGATSSTVTAIFENSSGADFLVMRDDLKLSFFNAAFNEVFNMVGVIRTDAGGFVTKSNGDAQSVSSAAAVRLWNDTASTGKTWYVESRNDGKFGLSNGDSSTRWLTVLANGKVGINDETPSYDLEVGGEIAGRHVIGNATANPTHTVGGSTVAGTGASATVIGNDIGFNVSLTLGSGISAAGTVLTVTFNLEYATAPAVAYPCPKDATTAAAFEAGVIWLETTATTVVLKNTNAFTSSQTLNFDVIVIGRVAA